MSVTIDNHDDVVLSATAVTKRYRGSPSPALNHVSIELRRGHIHGLVGESGSGKSTLARCLSLLEPLDGGQVEIAGQRIDRNVRRMRSHRRAVQLVFQHPLGAFDPRMSVAASLSEAMPARRSEFARDRPTVLVKALEDVGLDASALPRLPSAFSGGQLQRISIARALLVQPHVLIADEATSALDISVQAHVTNLLIENCRIRGTALLLVSHDLPLVTRIASTITVMRSGEVVDRFAGDADIASAGGPYTRELLAASLDPAGT